MIKAILFDLDNTLMDFMEMKSVASDAAIDAMIDAGLDLSQEEAKLLLVDSYEENGIENQKAFEHFLEKIQGTVDYKILSAGIVAYRKAKKVVPYPGVVPTLIKLRDKGLQLAIVSDAPILQAWTRLMEMGIQNYFEVIVTLDDTGQAKPSPLPFKRALHQLGLAPEEVIHIGDHPEKDIKGAKDLGIKTVLATYGCTHPVIVKPDYEINKIEDLVSLTLQ